MENHRLVRPEHLNHYGSLFGGYLLMWVDELAWLAASDEYRGFRFVTVGMDEVAFRKGVGEGAILCFRTKKINVGNTSVTYEVTVSCLDETIFSTRVTLVRIDGEGKKLPMTCP